jgi:hypothetical protein
MALTDIDISETLDVGAPSIKYTGNMDPNQMQATATEGQQSESDRLWQLELKKMELDPDYIPKIIDPEEMKIASSDMGDPMDNANEHSLRMFNKPYDQLTPIEIEIFEEEMLRLQSKFMASGGRVNFGLGSILKSVGKAAKKAVKSPVGKMALLGGLGYLANAGMLPGGAGSGWFSKFKPWMFGTKGGIGTSAGIGGLTGAGPSAWTGAVGTKGLLGKLGLTQGMGSMMPTALGWGTGAVAAGIGAGIYEGMQPNQIEELKNNPEALRAYLKQYHSNTNPEKSEEEVDIWVEQNMYSTGGRVGFAERGTIKDMTISDSQRDPKNMTTLEIISIIKGGKSTPEMFEELRLRGIEGVDEIELAEGQGDVGYSFDERLVDKYSPETGTSSESFLMNLRESNPDVYGKYRRPQNYPKVGPSTMDKNYSEQNFYAEPKWMKAQGGRIGFAFGPDQTAQAAGIMGGLPTRSNAAGVKELDLRDSGGFVPPVGIKEKADDIPAMLSNNEFVMTADAVKAAGGGSVEKGAQVMYDQMKKLENRIA